MAALNVASVEKKFGSVTNSQDSIQSLSLWVIHHKAHYEKIVELWFKCVKKAKIPHRLTLFYLCNDIVQTCKRKHAIVFKDSFKEVLKDAVLLVRDNSIKKNIERIFTIWEERSVYDADFMMELQALLDNSKARAAMNTRLLSEFQPQKVIGQLQSFVKDQGDGKLKKRKLKMMLLEDSNVEAIKQLKDRSHGTEYTQQFEDACVCLEEYITHLEKQVTEGHILVEMLEQGELFYDAQFGEAKVVVGAYKTFGARLNNLKKKLDELKSTLPDALSPIPSPTLDAPSPGNTPPHIRQAVDNTEVADMDMSDEETSSNKPGQAGPAGNKKYEFEEKSGHSVVTTESAKSATDPDSRKAADEAFTSFMSGLGNQGFYQTNTQSLGTNNGMSTPTWNPRQAYNDSPGFPGKVREEESGGEDGRKEGGDSTPVKDERDERSATPVMDEQPDEEDEAPGEDSNMSNPIEFLTQLITQTKKSNSASSNFLDTLSQLTSTVKNQHYSNAEDGSGASPRETDGEEGDGGRATPSSWAAWKAQQQNTTPPQVPPPPQPQPILPPPPIIPGLGSHGPMADQTPPPSQFPGQHQVENPPTGVPYPTMPPVNQTAPGFGQQPSSGPPYPTPPSRPIAPPPVNNPPYPIPPSQQPNSNMQPAFHPPPAPPRMPEPGSQNTSAAQFPFRPRFPPANYQQGPPPPPSPNVPQSPGLQRTPGPPAMQPPPPMPLANPAQTPPHMQNMPRMVQQPVPPPPPPMQSPMSSQQSAPSWSQAQPLTPNMKSSPSSVLTNSEPAVMSPRRHSPKIHTNRSNLTTIKTLDDDEEEGGNPTSPILTIGGSKSQQSRPMFPPRGSHRPLGHGNAETEDDAMEFIAKLKRKSVSTPGAPMPPPSLQRSDSFGNSNLRTLTMVKTDEPETEPDEVCSSEDGTKTSPGDVFSHQMSSESSGIDKKALEEASELLEQELALFQAGKSKLPDQLGDDGHEGAPISTVDSYGLGNHNKPDMSERLGHGDMGPPMRHMDQGPRPGPYQNFRRDPYYPEPSFRRDYHHNEGFFDRGPRRPFFRGRDRDHYGRPPPKRPAPPFDRRPYYRY